MSRTREKIWQMGLRISLLILLSCQAPRAHLDFFFSTFFFLNFSFFLESCLLIPSEWRLTTGAILLETLLCWKLWCAFHKLFYFPLPLPLGIFFLHARHAKAVSSGCWPYPWQLTYARVHSGVSRGLSFSPPPFGQWRLRNVVKDRTVCRHKLMKRSTWNVTN